MRTKDIGILALKLVGVYAVVKSLSHLSMLLSGLAVVEGVALEWDWRNVFLSGVLPVAILAAAGLVLILRAGAIAKCLKFDVGTTDGDETTGHDSAKLQAIAFSVAGLVVVGLTFPGLLSSAWVLVSRPTVWNHSAWGRLFGEVLQLAFGLWLFFGGGALARFWHRTWRKARSRDLLDSSGDSEN